ncbi:MAG TPA: hypothetical protein VJ998_10675, partial [Pseudomonadales bacterium]|nr:hypothetical protein [Pseudomonadales bacterium]
MYRLRSFAISFSLHPFAVVILQNTRARLIRALAVLCLLVAGPARATEVKNIARYDTDAKLDFSRAGFGRNDEVAKSGLSIWSKLDKLETRLLVNRKLLKADTGNTDALLALYLLASGDVKTETQFKAIHTSLM